jgi:hypothetical protein
MARGSVRVRHDPSSVRSRSTGAGRIGCFAIGVEFLLLGPVEVRSGGQRVAVGGPQAEKALAALLLAGGRVVGWSRRRHWSGCCG